MKLNETPSLPITPESDYDRRLGQVLYKTLREIAVKVNQLAAGRIAGMDATATIAPTSGAWAQGDTLRNSAPTELGTAGSRYVVIGWVCVAGGTPGTWVAMRSLTGN